MTKNLVVAIFPNRTTLVRALDHLQDNEVVTIKRAAVVAKAKTGETVILDDDLSPDEGGITGGTLGAAMAALGMVQLGALALPGVGTVIAIGAGALVGGLLGGVTGRFAAMLMDFGFRNDQIKALSTQLETGHPALVLDLGKDEGNAFDTLRKELTPFNVELIEPLHKAVQKPPPPDIE